MFQLDTHLSSLQYVVTVLLWYTDVIPSSDVFSNHSHHTRSRKTTGGPRTSNRHLEMQDSLPSPKRNSVFHKVSDAAE